MQPENTKLPNGNFLRIDSLWAWVSSDDEGEGIIGYGPIPLIGADLDRIESHREHAKAVAKLTGRAVRLVHFTTREELEVMEP